MNKEFYESNCIECQEEDDVNMVQCDLCDRWAHFGCVGVGPEIEDSDWCCRLCSGLSLTDASVGTESQTMHLKDASVGTESQTMHLTDAPVGTETQTIHIDSTVGMEAASYIRSSIGTNAPVIAFKFVKRDEDLSVVHLELDDEVNFEFYKNKLAKIRGLDMQDTVRQIGQYFIADSVLKEYSYLGRRKKYCFKKYDNITRLVVKSTIESMKRRHFEILGEEKEESKEEKKKLYIEVEQYFTAQYITKATVRYDRNRSRN